MTNTPNEFPPTAQATAATLRAKRNAWVPIPPKQFTDPSKNHRRGAPTRRKVRVIL